MRRIEGREKDSAFFAKMAAASFPEREGGHTGPYFNYQWGPLGAYAGSREALIMHFKHVSWHLDLCRRWDGGFEYSKILGKKDVLRYSGLDTSVPLLLTYAAPLKRLLITGKGLDGELLNSDDVKQVEFAALHDARKRSDDELLTDFASWSPKVKRNSGFEIAAREIEKEKLLSTLIPMVMDPNDPGRVAALWALGKVQDSRCAQTLADCLTDKDPWVRFVAGEAMRLQPQELKMAEVETILKACISTSKPEWPLDPEDPVQFAHGRLCMLLFYGGSAYGSKGVLSGKDVVNIDRALLYPAIRAVAKNPAGQCRGTLKYPYSHLTEKDLTALADTVVDAVVDRAPADSMFSASVRRAGVKLLREYGYIEAEKAAALVVESTMKNRQPKAIKELKKPDGYEASKTFKKIVSVSATPSGIKFPQKSAVLKVVASDQVNEKNLFTWKKLQGPGDADFVPNEAPEATVSTVTLSSPGKYLLEVTMTDPLGLSEVSETISLEVSK